MFARSAARRLARAALALSLGLGLAVPAMADGLRIQKSGKSRIAQIERQTRLLDSRLAGQYQQSARLRPKGTSTKSVVDLALPGTIPAYSGNRRSQYLPHARAMARKHGVPEDLFLRPGDGFVGMAGFGASAPAPALYRHFGITAERAAELAGQLIQGGK